MMGVLFSNNIALGLLSPAPERASSFTPPHLPLVHTWVAPSPSHIFTTLGIVESLFLAWLLGLLIPLLVHLKLNPDLSSLEIVSSGESLNLQWERQQTTGFLPISFGALLDLSFGVFQRRSWMDEQVVVPL